MQRFRTLFGEYNERIFNFCYYFLGNREDAEDVTQEVLVRIWSSRPQIEGAHLTAWIMRVTRNACVDASRKRRTYRTVVGSDPTGETLNQARSLEPDPAMLVEASDFQRHLARVLLTLPETQRAIIVLREIQQMKYEEMGQVLGLRLKVKARFQLKQITGSGECVSPSSRAV